MLFLSFLIASSFWFRASALTQSTPTASTRTATVSLTPTTSLKTTLSVVSTRSLTTSISLATTTTSVGPTSTGLTNTPPDLPANYTYLGCYSDISTARALSKTYLVPGGHSNLTIENCLSTCLANNYRLAGVEYGTQCWCDNYIQPLPSSGLCIDPAFCKMPCSGNRGEICGGPNAINIYSFDPYISARATCCKQVPASSSGLIVNGNFENGLAPWTVSHLHPGRATVDVTSNGEAYSGCSALRIHPTNTADQQDNQVSISQNVSGITIGYKYTLSLFSGFSAWNATGDWNIRTYVGLSMGGSHYDLWSNTVPCAWPNCKWKGQNSSSFEYEGWGTIIAEAASFTLIINVTWTDQMNGMDFLIDGIVLEQGDENGFQ